MGNSCQTSQIVDPVETRFNFQTPIIATGKKGSAPGELYRPCGVAIDGATDQMLVANHDNDRVEIFSETGEFLYQLGVGQLLRPSGIAIHGDSVYVSWIYSNVSRFSLTEMCLVRRIGYGLGNSENSQLTTDPIGRVFVIDDSNDRICGHDPDLNHLYNITTESLSFPTDVKISRDRLYVLCANSTPCMHVLTLEGDKLHSLISCGREIFCFFCLDLLDNFVISDEHTHSIRVFSPEDNLLHTTEREGHQPGVVYHPRGVAVTPNGRLVCVSANDSVCEI